MYLGDEASTNDCAALVGRVFRGTDEAAEFDKALVLGFGVVAEDLLEFLLHDW